MKEVISNSVYFGIALSLICYWIALSIHKKWPLTILNPLLLSTVMIIAILILFQIDYETYDIGAKYLTYFIQPATICLAVPLYRQLRILKDNIAIVLVSVTAGCLSNVIFITVPGLLWKLNPMLIRSILPKSVTTAIAIGISEEIGGIPAITILAVVITGLSGAVIAPFICRLFKIQEPVAQGLGIGTAAHAVGTSKALEMGEIQGAMSSLAIVAAGLVTVIIVPLISYFIQ